MSNSRTSANISFNAGTLAPKKYDTVTTEYPDDVTVVRRFRSGGISGKIMATVTTVVDAQGRELYTTMTTDN
jgi:hypothetical protein